MLVLAHYVGTLSPIARARSFSKRVMNPIARPVAGRMPGMANLRYVGRTTGTAYRIPMVVYRDGSEFIIALTYGPDVQWLKNVIAAGGCEIEVRGKTYHVIEPRVFNDKSMRFARLPLRFFNRVIRCDQFVGLRIDG